MNPKVDFYFSKGKQWQEEFERLRAIVLDSELEEELKWGCPCYTYEKRNVVLMHGFKEYCALLFFKGALLKDPSGILIRQTENVQAARQIRFTGVREIAKMKPIVIAYIHEAIEAEKAGLKVKFRAATELKLSAELQKKFKTNSALKTAFRALTPGRQRAYNLYFSAPKQLKTREARIAKCIPKILRGKGLND